MRGFGGSRGGWAVVVVGAALTGATLVLVKLWLPGAIAAGVGAIIAIVGGGFAWTAPTTSV